MVSICSAVCRVCGTDVDSCEDRDRRCKLESCDGDSDDGGSCDGRGMVFLTHAQSGIGSISRKSWLFLILSGLATGASWLCYYRALQVGEASKVVPIDKLSVVIALVLAFVLLHEQVSVKAVAGCILIGAGTLLMVL